MLSPHLNQKKATWTKIERLRILKDGKGCSPLLHLKEEDLPIKNKHKYTIPPNAHKANIKRMELIAIFNTWWSKSAVGTFFQGIFFKV